MADYQLIATEARKKVLELIYRAQTSHIGSNFSAIDIMAVLFSKIDLDKDKFVLSAGWKAASLYYFLWKKGRITEEELNSYCQEGSKFIGLAEPVCKDIMIAGGSMCMGLSGALGLALANRESNIYVLESDGGMNGGPVWEALAIAKHQKLNNLVLIIDKNLMQAMGETKEIMDMDSLSKKLESFGWQVKKINGHDYKVIERVLRTKRTKPLAIIAETIKGYPISFMMGRNFYHYAQLTKKMYLSAQKELNA